MFDEQASDEFEGETLDRSKWDDWVESFQGRRSGFLFSRDNVDVAKGELKLTARLLREDEKTFDNFARGFDTYATAIVKSKKKTFYGYYECRAKSMKAAVCNAFWLYDPLSDEPKKKYRPGDFSEEIDIFEIFGKEGSKKSDCARAFYNTVHRLGTPYLEGRVLGSVEKLPEKSSRKKVDFDFADATISTVRCTSRLTARSCTAGSASPTRPISRRRFPSSISATGAANKLIRRS